MLSAPLLHESWAAGVEKFVALGTICCYPKFTPVPFREENLWDGYPEETNALLRLRSGQAVWVGEKNAARAKPGIPAAVRVQ